MNIECRVMEIKEYPTHDMFIAEIVSVSVDDSLMDETGKLCLDEAGLVAYNHGHYFALQKKEIGRFGYSVMKPKTRKRIEAEKRRSLRHGSDEEDKVRYLTSPWLAPDCQPENQIFSC